MKPLHGLFTCALIAMNASAPQSLSELARKEAERRKAMDQLGIQGKTVEQGDSARLAPGGNVSLSKLPPISKSLPKPPAQLGEKASANKYRTELQQFDREIRRNEERLTSLRGRLQTERAAPVRLGKGSGRMVSAVQERLQAQINDLEAKIKRLRDDRLRVYDSGRKAGFLPGELDGKGIIP
jgi:hypothetical protein